MSTKDKDALRTPTEKLLHGHTLIDRQVSPFSPRSEIIAWAETCRRESARDTDSKQWLEELGYAERLLENVSDEAAIHDADRRRIGCAVS